MWPRYVVRFQSQSQLADELVHKRSHPTQPGFAIGIKQRGSPGLNRQIRKNPYRLAFGKQCTEADRRWRLDDGEPRKKGTKGGQHPPQAGCLGLGFHLYIFM